MAIAIPEIEASTDVETVKQALSAGHLTVEVRHAPGTCHHRLMYARCPHGHVAAVYPAQRDGIRIETLVMHCPTCGADYPATPDDVTLG